MAKISFIVAEPNFIIRKGLVSIINELANTKVIGELEGIKSLTGTSAFAQVLVVSSKLLAQAGKADCQALLAKQKNIFVICVSSHNEELPAHVHPLCYTRIFLEDNRETVIEKLKKVQEQIAVPQTPSSNQTLSEREVQILKDIALGLSNKEIAEKNFISQHTVITHRKNITNKLGIKTVSGLTIYAMLNKLIEIGDTEAGG